MPVYVFTSIILTVAYITIAIIAPPLAIGGAGFYLFAVSVLTCAHRWEGRKHDRRR